MRGSSRLALLLFFAFTNFAAQAAAPDPAALQDLRQQFAERIGRKMQQADLLMSGENSLELMELKSGSTIAEGEQLIMRGTVGDKSLQLGQEIIAVKQNGRLLVSLFDVVTALEFPVTVSPAEGAAAGWFVREDQPFQLDVKKLEVTIAGETARLAPEDISAGADDILVSVALVEKWAGMTIGMDLQGLALSFKGARPLPIEEKERRKKLPKYAASDTDKAQLPLKQEPYHIFSKPYLDVNIGAGTSRPDGNSPMRSTSAWSAIGAGDMLGFSSRVFAAGNWDSDGNGEALGALRLTFGREDPDGHVLGLPGVRSVEFGDVDAVNLPLVGGGVQEQGVYLSNRLAGDITTQSRMDIRGDTLPGWDVELYNNESLLGLQTAGNDGRYNFPAVFLFEGENVMRLVFFGPQGETREEIRRVVSHASSLEAGQSKWETSLTRTNETTYNAQDSDTPIDGDPHLTARYEYSFGPQASVNLGATHRSEIGGTASDTKDYLQAGIATNLAGALVTADAAYDTDGEYIADVLARRSFGPHQTGLQLQHSSGEFPMGGLASFAPENLVQANIRGPFADSFLGLSSVSYTADAGYSTGSNDTKGMHAGASLNGRAGNFGVSTSLNYNNSETLGVGTPSEDRLTGATSVRGNVGRGRWRLSTDYGVQPFDLQNVAANYTYPFSPQLQGVAEVRHQAQTSLSALELSARWRHDKFVLSPRVEVDTDEQLTLGVNMNFSLADDPYGEGYSMYNRGLTSTGGVAARVYLDKNGDGIFNEGDELLPDVDVRSLQSGGRGTTGAKGVAFIPSLQRGVRTDIVVQPETLPDPYYQPSTPGNSVRPRPGVTSPLDFPVVVGGELDGQAGFANVEGKAPSLRGMRVKLVAPDGTEAQSAAVGSDGYYSMSGVRPGVYYLLAETGRGSPAGSVAPRTLVFTSEGSTYFGENILLTPGDETRFSFKAANDSPAAKRPGRIVRQEDIAGRGLLIHVGEYRSKLALTLAQYRFRMMSGPWEGLFSVVDPVEDETAGEAALKGIVMKPARPLGMADAAATCRALQEQSYKCRIEVVTRYHDPAPEPPSAVVVPKKTAEAAPLATAPQTP